MYQMPKAPTGKVYAVLIGREGPQIYDNLQQFKAATLGFSASSAKSFATRFEAERWIESAGHTIPRRPNGGEPSGAGMSVASAQGREHPLNDTRESGRLPHDGPLIDANAAPRVPLANLIPPRDSEIRLSQEQLNVISMIRRGENVFFTGPAGTGKSVLLREIIKILSPYGDSKAVTASTGIAGLNIGGSTVHSWAGIGLGKEPAEKLADKIKFSKKLANRWRETSILIIDEISMLDGTLFDKLEFIARKVRHNTEPFGGIQLILTGDFFQLPPVPDQSHQYAMAATYAFDAKSWRTCISTPVMLTQVFRQKDNTFVEILSAMRSGRLSEEHIRQLRRLSRPLVYADGIEPSQLYPLRAEVERCNNQRLAELTGEPHVFRSTDSAGYDVHSQPVPRASALFLLERLVATAEVTLKVGAQVMLIRNIERGLVNGSVGKVVDFLTTHEALERHIQVAETKREDSSEEPRTRPTPRDRDAYYLNNNLFQVTQRFPVVEFLGRRQLLCVPIEFSVQGFLGNIEARRMQVPLILAWALSIHKSQGQTLTRVKIDLQRVFENGQAYVAVSRATEMESLEIQNFDPSKIKTDFRVIQWHETWMPPSVKTEVKSESRIMNVPPIKREASLQSDLSWIDDEMDSEEALEAWRALGID